jgi:hypothetical protein
MQVANTSRNAFRGQPTQDGIAVVEFFQKEKEKGDALVAGGPYAAAKNGIVAAALSDFAARRGSAPDDQLLSDLWHDYVESPQRQFFPYAEFSARIKDRLRHTEPAKLGYEASEEVPGQAEAAIKTELDRISLIDSRPTPGEPLQPEGLEDDAGFDLTSSEGRIAAITTYTERWTTDSFICSEASLARTAKVDPADLSKWKKGRLPVGSDKKVRIEKALKDNQPPTPLSRPNSDT